MTVESEGRIEKREGEDSGNTIILYNLSRATIQTII